MAAQRSACRPWLAAGLIAVAALAGCTPAPREVPPPPSLPAPASSPAPASPSAPLIRPAPQPAVRCGSPAVSARQLVLHTADGTDLDASLLGAGARGVLLVPELGRQNLCGWWDYATFLAGRGYHVLLFDHRCAGFSGCPVGGGDGNGLLHDIEAAVAALRAAGTRGIALVGASQGAAEVLIAGAVAPPGVASVAALSPDETGVLLAGPPIATADQAAPALRLPVLVAIAPGDLAAPLADVQALYARVASRDKQLVVDGSQTGIHGWDLLAPDAAGRRPALSATLQAFLHRTTG